MKPTAATTMRVHLPPAAQPPTPEGKVAPGPSHATGAALSASSGRGDAGAAPRNLTAIQDAMRRLRQAPVPIGKAIFAEGHDEPENLDLAGRMLEGAVAGASGPIHLYKEFNFHPGSSDEAQIEQRGLKQDTKGQVLGYIVQHHAAPSVPRKVEDITRFATAGMSKDVSVQLLNYVNPNRRDMSRFVQDKEFAIAWTGCAHVLKKLLPDPKQRDLVTEPWLGKYHGDVATRTIRNLAVPPEVLRQASVTRAAQEDMFDGFARAQEVPPTVLVMSNRIWLETEVGESATVEDGRVLGPMEKRARFIEHCNSKELIAVEVPVDATSSALLVMPGEYLPQMRELRDTDPERVKIFWHGLPGSAPAPEREEPL